jgi:hypothetical protein
MRKKDLLQPHRDKTITLGYKRVTITIIKIIKKRMMISYFSLKLNIAPSAT